MSLSLAAVREQFEYFAEQECGDAAPLYRAIAAGVAKDDDLLALANEGREGVRRPNLLLGAVHMVALEHPELTLAQIYRDSGPIEGALEAFRGAVPAHRERVRQLVREKLVQTNEVNRCSYLLPGLIAAQGAMGGKPLGLIDVGASAGLHLVLDRYGYRYSDGTVAGDPASALQIACEVRGDGPVPLGTGMPVIASRVGLDLEPLDLADEESRLWLQALMWPEQPERMARLLAAMAIARERPPRVVAGDAMDLLPGIVREVEPGVTPVVMHSHVLAHFPQEARREFGESLMPALGRERDLAWLACEGSTMVLTTWRGGERREVLLARRDPHGEWIEWLA